MRAEWLTCLVHAIEGAQRLAWQLRTDESASGDARELYSRLEQVRLELESLRGIATRPADLADPEWLRKLGWGTAALALDDQDQDQDQEP